MRRRAFTLTELLMVIGIIAILAALLLPVLASASHKSKQTACFNNLHQVGLAFANFALDHEGKYPMQLPERLEGSMEHNRAELVTNTEFSRAFQHFAALSNQMKNPRIFVCPADKTRKPANNYSGFSGANLSYWVNPRATPHATLSMLAGDWNLTSVTQDVRIQPILTFNKQVHRLKGSVLFADGRVEMTRSFAYAKPEPETQIATKPPGPTPGSVPTVQPGSTPIAGPTPGAGPVPRTLPEAGSSKLTKAGVTTPSKTNQTVLTNYGGGTVAGSPRSSSVKSPQPSTPEPMPPRATPVPQLSAGGVGSPSPESDEPWDTPRFRLFKFFALASYLISLLWALLALLALYLKSRLAARRKELETAR